MAEEKPEAPGEKPETSEEKSEAAEAAETSEKKSATEGDKSDKAKAKGGKGKILVIAAAAVLVLLIGGGAAFFLLSGSDKASKKAKVDLPPPPGPMTTYSFPKVLADLKTGKCRSPYLSMRFMVEVGKNYTKVIQKKQPKLLEGVQLHLRSLERQDLVGKVGSDRLRADIFNIINRMIKPGKIEGVIFKEFILQ